MRGLLRRIQSLWSWRAVRQDGVWVYCENSITGRRSAHWTGGCYGPLDQQWLRDGDFVHGPRGSYVVGAESEIWAG
ncbi:hypothetical protein [Enterovirga aerilata]|uniref:Uncharacterized protein n=1 Tax=Enterovirga aerilata TaxID=2730920 RepID=A0A849IFQ8_9HYPH|nr:hypothetical protein [Enterovirga sp. DB1703]NNM75055.1 hypothetical protein [Enterovirga sp. DB1703]